MTTEPVTCRICGGFPEVHLRLPIETGRYQGFVECTNCGWQIYGKLKTYDRDDAAEDAVEEWNEEMRRDDE